MTKKTKFKERKAIDAVKEWMKENCKKGEIVEILSSKKVMVLRATGMKATDFMFAYKVVDSRNKKDAKRK